MHRRKPSLSNNAKAPSLKRNVKALTQNGMMKIVIKYKLGIIFIVLWKTIECHLFDLDPKPAEMRSTSGHMPIHIACLFVALFSSIHHQMEYKAWGSEPWDTCIEDICPRS